MRVWQITDTISAIDHNLLASPGVGATYVLRGESVALVETGTSLTVPNTLAGLEQLGIHPDQVSHIFCTHVHMDHAGGAGALAQTLTRAKVVIHSMTASHLVDPTKLMPSVRRAVGETLWAVTGTVVPVDADRLLPAENLRLDLGKGIVLESIPTPGHSPDHISYFEHGSGSLFTGDAIGVHFSTLGVMIPVTVVPSFDLEAQRNTFDRVKSLGADRFLVTHFGETTDTMAMWNYLYEKTEECAEAAAAAIELDDEPDSLVLTRRHLPVPAHFDQAAIDVIEGWGKMTFDGLVRYFRKRREHART